MAPDSARALQVKCLMFEAPLIQTRLSGRMGSGWEACATVDATRAIRGAASQLALIVNAPGLDGRLRQVMRRSADLPSLLI
jgi:hypothetical protein